MTTENHSAFRKKLRKSTGIRLSATQIIILGFLLLILVGGVLLSLPISSAERKFTPFDDALFTSVSATCVTGLTVLPSGTYWSLFGQIVIIVLIQIGGLGFMSLAVMLSIFAKRQISPRERVIAAQSLGLSNFGGTVKLVKRILSGTLCFELTGTIILSTQFVPEFGFPRGVWYGLFHSVSAFCNAGFDLLDSFDGFRENYLVGITVMLLIVIGGIGFIVWDDIVNFIKSKKRISVYSRFVISVTAVLLLSGALLIALFEWNNPATIGNMSIGDKLYHSIFQSVTTRTAGIDFINNSAMTDSSKLICLFYMLIGGASGSTAGGVKVGSFGVLVLAVLSFTRGSDEIILHKRKISHTTVVRALTAVSINLSAGILGGILVSIADGVGLLQALYETISAISTVGLSLSLTPGLSLFSHIVIMILMFFGRVGILTITYSLMLKGAHKKSCISYPEVTLMIG